MKKNFLFISAILIISIILCGFKNNPQQYVSVSLDIFPEKIISDKPLYIGVKASLKDNYHININKPDDEFLIPTVLKIEDDNNSIKNIEYIYPEYIEKKFDFSEQKIKVYEKEFYIIAKIIFNKNINEAINLKYKLSFQPCDNSNCYAPQIIENNISLAKKAINDKLNLEKIPEFLEKINININEYSVKKIKQINEQNNINTSNAQQLINKKNTSSIKKNNRKDLSEKIKISNTDKHQTEGTIENTYQNTKQKNSILIYLIFAFLGGIILNIMPCVLPVISIKILSLFKQSGKDISVFRKNNFIFISGIFTTFIALSLIVISIKSAGESIGWGFQFQSPKFLIFIISLVFAFALSLLGIFIINIPVPNSMLKKTQKIQGGLQHFFEGVLVTFLATPCTAPFLGTSIGFAFSQSAFFIFLIFIFIALGMCLPYIILGIFPQFNKYLPKPGEWMETFKKIMGFVLLATVIWLVWILLKITHYKFSINILNFLFSLSIALWIIGNFIKFNTSFKKKIIIWIISIAIFSIGLIYFIKPILAYKQDEKTSGQNIIIKHNLKWNKFSEKLLNNLLKTDKIIFIDFTADWCLTCQFNKKNVLYSDEVTEVFKNHNVKLIYADWTKNDPLITKYLNKFSKAGVPLYVIYPSDKNISPIILPEILTKKIIIKGIKNADIKAE